MDQFDLNDLNRDFLSADAREAMLELILAWAYLDGALALWVAAKFDIPADKCAVLLGRTDGKGKLRKLQTLYDLQGHKDVAAEIRKSGKIYDEQVARRNTSPTPVAGAAFIQTPNESYSPLMRFIAWGNWRSRSSR